MATATPTYRIQNGRFTASQMVGGNHVLLVTFAEPTGLWTARISWLCPLREVRRTIQMTGLADDRHAAAETVKAFRQLLGQGDFGGAAFVFRGFGLGLYN